MKLRKYKQHRKEFYCEECGKEIPQELLQKIVQKQKCFCEVCGNLLKIRSKYVKKAFIQPQSTFSQKTENKEKEQIKYYNIKDLYEKKDINTNKNEQKSIWLISGQFFIIIVILLMVFSVILLYFIVLPQLP